MGEPSFSWGDYDERSAEKLDLLLIILSNERVTWSRKFRPPLDDQGIYTRSQQEPLPVWVGVGGTPQSIVRAGLRGLLVALSIIGGNPERFGALGQLFRRTLTDSGFDPAAVPLAVHAHGHIADFSDQAVREFLPSYAPAMTRLGRERGWGPMTRPQFDAIRSPEGSLILGTTEEVATRLLRWKEILGISRFVLHISVGTMPHEQVMPSIELLGTEVARLVRGS
jgi:alkanesulfonate monooxygenase SsuD/methylene tetrahydromethanopterin reductase-like flavin-dependent oxidoreductase (luciferase family)